MVRAIPRVSSRSPRQLAARRHTAQLAAVARPKPKNNSRLLETLVATGRQIGRERAV